MKNPGILLCFILCLNACKKSPDHLPVTPASLSGTWGLQTATSLYYTNGVRSNTSTTTYNTTGVGFSSLDLDIYFSDNLTGTYQQPGLAGLPFTYLISGNHLALKYNSNVPTEDLQTSFTIKTLTNNQLELVYGTASGNGIVYDDIYIKN